MEFLIFLLLVLSHFDMVKLSSIMKLFSKLPYAACKISLSSLQNLQNEIINHIRKDKNARELSLQLRLSYCGLHFHASQMMPSLEFSFVL